jgi:hypothetical protein
MHTAYVFAFWLVFNFLYSLYILDVNPLSDESESPAKIFSPSLVAS